MSITQQQHIPFSFHCSICFEPFDHNTRPPVILPCGHTFLCRLCSKRLKRCMECRTPLFMMRPSDKLKAQQHQQQQPPPPPPLYQRQHHHHQQQRHSHHHRQSPTKPPPKMEEPIPLPLPKNLLLLHLMEAAERECSAKRRVACDTRGSLAFSYSEDSTLEEEEYDEDRVRAGVIAVTRMCGTYAVSEVGGLRVVRGRPEGFEDEWGVGERVKGLKSVEKEEEGGVGEVEGEGEESEKGDGDVGDDNNSDGDKPEEEIERSSIEKSSIKSSSIKSPSIESPSIESLEYGVRVQVVDIQNGWAKLARNRGYVAFMGSQLVKVDGPQDPACKIEGSLYSVIARKRSVTSEINELQNMERYLVNELEKVLMEPPPSPDNSSTISSDQKCHSPDRDDHTHDSTNAAPPLPVDMSPPLSPYPPPVLPRRITNSTRHVEFSDTTDFASLSPSPFPPIIEAANPQIPNSLGDKLKQKLADDFENESSQIGCSPFLGISSLEAERDHLLDHPRSLSSTASVSPQRRQRQSSVSPLRTTPRSPERYPPGGTIPINFRTGMSGHMGLMSTKAHTEPPKRAPIRMMGEHRGLARIRPIRKRPEPTVTSDPSKSPNLSTTTW